MIQFLISSWCDSIISKKSIQGNLSCIVATIFSSIGIPSRLDTWCACFALKSARDMKPSRTFFKLCSIASTSPSVIGCLLSFFLSHWFDSCIRTVAACIIKQKVKLVALFLVYVSVKICFLWHLHYQPGSFSKYSCKSLRCLFALLI